MCDSCESKTGWLVDLQLEMLREEYHNCDEEELFRMYLHYMLECRTEEFFRIISGETKVVAG